MALLIALHILAAVVWVGGMFFAYVVLRPSAGPLSPEERQSLWQRVFSKFFPWVWVCVIVLLVSGYAIIFLYYGGFANLPLSIHLMQGIGIVMMLLFAHLFFAPWRRFSAAVTAKDFAEGGKRLNQIRQIVAINLILGLVTVAVAGSGRFW